MFTMSALKYFVIIQISCTILLLFLAWDDCHAGFKRNQFRREVLKTALHKFLYPSVRSGCAYKRVCLTCCYKRVCLPCCYKRECLAGCYACVCHFILTSLLIVNWFGLPLCCNLRLLTFCEYKMCTLYSLKFFAGSTGGDWFIGAGQPEGTLSYNTAAYCCLLTARKTDCCFVVRLDQPLLIHHFYCCFIR